MIIVSGDLVNDQWSSLVLVKESMLWLKIGFVSGIKGKLTMVKCILCSDIRLAILCIGVSWKSGH